MSRDSMEGDFLEGPSNAVSIIRSSFHCLLVVFTFSSCIGNESTGATIQTVDPKPSCPNCRIELTPVATLSPSDTGTSPRPDAVGRECMLALDDNGNYLFSGPIGGGRIEVYDTAGRFVRSIGRKGSGPGEMGGMVRLVVGRGDTLVVIDEAHVRVQILSPLGDYIRSFPLPSRLKNLAVLQSGDVVFFRSPTQEAESVYVVFDLQEREVARFGGPTGVPRDLEFGIVTKAPGGGLWTASIWKYELARWSAPGALELTLRRDADWFPPNAPYPDGAFETVLPPPALTYAWEDEHGRLWTFVTVPDPDWKPGGPRQSSPEFYERTFDTVIEVIDLAGNRLVAATRVETRLAAVCGTGLVYTIVETATGDTRVQVLRPTLVQPGS